MGSHTCLFYESEKSLLDLVASFFKQGFTENEAGVWVVPQSLGIKGAKAALSNEIKDLGRYIEKGQFELLSHKDVYLGSGVFDQDKVLALLVEKEQDAETQGFGGLRVSGDASWLPEKDWDKMNGYEKKADKLLRHSKITALCTYPSEKFDMGQMFSLSFSHEVLIRKENGKTDVLLDKRDISK